MTPGKPVMAACVTASKKNTKKGKNLSIESSQPLLHYGWQVLKPPQVSGVSQEDPEGNKKK